MKPIATALWTAASLVPAAIGYAVVGWLGVGIVGLIVTFLAVRIEIEGDGPIGGLQDAGYHAAHRERWRCAEASDREGVRAERRATLRALTLAELIGGVLVLVGLSGFFLVQLRA